MTTIKQKYIILGYSNGQLVNKECPPLGIFEDFVPGNIVAIQVTLLKILALYIFLGWHNC